MLAYGVPADALDEYICIGESTALEALRNFVVAVVEVFGPEFLRMPSEQDTTRLLAIGASRGFLGMLGSIDCMHWSWKNCPTAWHGMYRGYKIEPTIILKAVASKDLWIWHALFACLVHAMTKMCFKDLLYLQGLLRGEVHKIIITSMGMIIQWVII